MGEQGSHSIALYAAGSLHSAFEEIAAAYEAASSVSVNITFGPSGILRERIEAGDTADVYASADMGHPTKLMRAGRAGPAVMFARTEVCALVRGEESPDPDGLLAYLLDPAVRVGVSTPGDDPLGDYTVELFQRAEAVEAGSYATLSAKALRVMGGRDRAVAVPAGKHPITYVLEESRAIDVMFVYCANAQRFLDAAPSVRLVSLPASLRVQATFGLTALSQDSAEANRLAMTILSPDGQEILARHGFEAPLLVRPSA